MAGPIRLKATDPHGGVAYVYRRGGETRWRCALASGTPASFSFAGVRDAVAFSFALEDVRSVDDAIIACERHGSARYVYELV